MSDIPVDLETMHPVLDPTNYNSSAGIFTGKASLKNRQLEEDHPNTIMAIA